MTCQTCKYRHYKQICQSNYWRAEWVCTNGGTYGKPCERWKK